MQTLLELSLPLRCVRRPSHSLVGHASTAVVACQPILPGILCGLHLLRARR
jgi:hypothetical protein